MSSDDTYCPACDRECKWFEAVCPSCGGELAASDSRIEATSDAERLPPVVVFESDDAIEADEVRAALADRGIVCAVSGPSPFVPSLTGGPCAVTVRHGDVERARVVLETLDGEGAGASEEAVPVADRVSDLTGSAETKWAAISLHDSESGLFLGRITGSQLEFLAAHLEEDVANGTYYVDDATIDLLADRGANEALASILRGALRGRAGAEIRWSEEP